MTIISAHAPTLFADEGTKDKFFSALTLLLQRLNREDRLALMGEFNARAGVDAGFRRKFWDRMETEILMLMVSDSCQHVQRST